MIDNEKRRNGIEMEKTNSGRHRGERHARNMRITPILESCRTLGEPIAAQLGLELFDVRLVHEEGRLILRYVIDCEEGVTHQHCEQFSKLIDPLLDEADPIEKSYFLEVSSPGAERPLRHEADFKRFIGHWAGVVAGDVDELEIYVDEQDRRVQVDGRVRPRQSPRRPKRSSVIEGKIVAIQDGIVTLQISEQQQRDIPICAIVSAHLLLDQSGGERKRK